MEKATEIQTSEVKHIDSTIETLEKSIEKETINGASPAITKWMASLEGHMEFKPILGKLEKLKSALADKDGKKIVELMTSLGEETSKAGENAEGDEGKKVKMLGKALSSAAKAISKFA